jgi:Fe-S oxidoreductase
MSVAWMAAHGDRPADRSHGTPVWGCTGCYACRELCDHRNPVADVLLEARAAFVSQGAAPEGIRRVLARFARHEAATRERARALGARTGAHLRAADVLLVGCGYLRGAPREAADAVAATRAVTRAPVALLDSCCGLPLRLAGDAAGFARHAARVAALLAPHARVIVVDAGCGVALRRHYPEAGVGVAPRVDMLVELAARDASGYESCASPTEGSASGLHGAAAGPVRWHDPCQLGRGLGLYDAPRTVLTWALGRTPDEFRSRREHAACAGSGGLLPAAFPGAARSISRARMAEHGRAGGGRVVTACAASLLSLRRAAGYAAAGARRERPAVDDLVTWIARKWGAQGT